MNRLDQLPELTEQALGGLTAGDDLKHRILAEAANNRPRSERSFLRPAVGLMSAAAVMAAFLLILNTHQPQSEAVEDVPVLRSCSAGSVSSSPGILPVFASGLHVVSVETPYSDTAFTDDGTIDLLVSALRSAETDGSSSDNSFSGEIILHLSDGTDFRCRIDDPYLSCNGQIWSCPQFFTLLKDLSGQ